MDMNERTSEHRGCFVTSSRGRLERCLIPFTVTPLFRVKSILRSWRHAAMCFRPRSLKKSHESLVQPIDMASIALQFLETCFNAKSGTCARAHLG